MKLLQWQARCLFRVKILDAYQPKQCLNLIRCQPIRREHLEGSRPMGVQYSPLSIVSETNKDWSGLQCSLYWNNKWEKEILFEWQKLCSHIYNVFVPRDTLRLERIRERCYVRLSWLLLTLTTSHFIKNWQKLSNQSHVVSRGLFWSIRNQEIDSSFFQQLQERPNK